MRRAAGSLPLWIILVIGWTVGGTVAVLVCDSQPHSLAQGLLWMTAGGLAGVIGAYLSDLLYHAGFRRGQEDVLSPAYVHSLACEVDRLRSEVSQLQRVMVQQSLRLVAQRSEIERLKQPKGRIVP